MSGFTKGVYDIDPETGLSKWRDSDGRLSHVSSKTARRILADERNFAKAKVHKDHITHKQKAALNRESDFVRMDKVIRTVDDRKARLETRVNYSVSRLNDARTVAEARRRKVDLQDINVATIDDLELTDRLQELAKPVVRKYYQTRRKISNLRANASDKRVTKRQRIVNERSLSRDIAAEKARETRDFFGITRS